MDMDAMEELSDRVMIVKGRRTKRTRLEASPVSAVVTSSGDGSGGEEGGGGEINSLIPSVSAGSEISTSTEEDEDMANCLILLAQSGCSSTAEDHQDVQEKIKMEKNNMRSRKFAKMVTTTTTAAAATTTTIAKVGIYVYECKTCNRTFPSFQALGGHRASHKKPKTTSTTMAAEENKKTPLILTPSHDHQDKQQQQPPPPPHIIANNKSTLHGIITSKTKVHECSICGLEFSSGQALGGHMRRHRTTTTSSKVTMSIETSTTESSSHDGGERPRNNVLQLDLNLPAPEDDHHDSKFQFSSPNQQHIFSSPALVGCHY